MRLLLLLLIACEGGTIRVPGDPVVPVDRPDDPTDTPTTGETAPLPADSAGPPPLSEHTCVGTTPYTIEWDLPPQPWDEPPRYGAWAMNSSGGQNRWRWLVDVNPNGRPTTGCSCGPDGICSPERWVVFEL